MKFLTKNLLFKSCIIACSLIPLVSFAKDTKNTFPSLDNMTVSDYTKLYYSDSPKASERLKDLNADAVGFLIASDIYSREVQGKALFCSDKKNDAVNLTPGIFSDLIINNLSRLDVHQDVISIKDVMPFTYYALGVMAETYPCQNAKKPFNLFEQIELSYIKAKNKAMENIQA